jgi:hypothetical protein
VWAYSRAHADSDSFRYRESSLLATRRPADRAVDHRAGLRHGLGFAFHGPKTWEANMLETGFFVDHFTFTAGLLYMTAFGPGPLGLRR